MCGPLAVLVRIMFAPVGIIICEPCEKESPSRIVPVPVPIEVRALVSCVEFTTVNIVLAVAPVIVPLVVLFVMDIVVPGF